MKNMKKNVIEVCIWIAIFAICVVEAECVRLVSGLEVLNTYWAFGPIEIGMDVKFVVEYAISLWIWTFISCKAGNAIWYRKKKD